MAEMIKQMIYLCLWISMASYCLATSTTEIPQECAIGTSDFNEKLCNETCTHKEEHMSKPYCANFTQVQPQAGVRSAEVPVTEIADVFTPKTDVSDFPTAGSSSKSIAVQCLIIYCVFQLSALIYEI